MAERLKRVVMYSIALGPRFFKWKMLSFVGAKCLAISTALDCSRNYVRGSKRHSIQAVDLSQRTQAAVQIVLNLPVFGAYRPCGPAGWLALLLTKAGDVETNPGPTTLNKQAWICDICHKQIHVRKQISIRCKQD